MFKKTGWFAKKKKNYPLPGPLSERERAFFTAFAGG
jgi:hypothetical protein